MSVGSMIGLLDIGVWLVSFPCWISFSTWEQVSYSEWEIHLCSKPHEESKENPFKPNVWRCTVNGTTQPICQWGEACHCSLLVPHEYTHIEFNCTTQINWWAWYLDRCYVSFYGIYSKWDDLHISSHLFSIVLNCFIECIEIDYIRIHGISSYK